MRYRFTEMYWAGVLILALSGTAQATLIDRGGGLIYDDVLDVTWLQDGNYAKTSGYDSTGSMGWDDAVAWADGLSYGGYDDWRLPGVVDTGSAGCDFAYADTDCGYNVQTTSGATVYSEMASLWYDTLGNLAYYDTSGDGPQTGWGLANTGPFTNVQTPAYWYGTVDASIPDSSYVWGFRTNEGYQLTAPKFGGFAYAWAVRSGDVTAAPEPATALLLGAGLAGLGLLRRRKA